MRVPRSAVAVAIVAALVAMDRWRAAARQLPSRPDPQGLALRIPHGSASGSLRLQQVDPWLAYEVGRALFMREWTEGDGLFQEQASRPIAGATTSCAMCHNLPFRTPGSGGTIGEPAATGRNVPHLFGVGLVELIAEQISQRILLDFDRNGDGVLNVPAETAGRRAIIEAEPGVRVDFGALDDLNHDGYPGLTDAIQVAVVDRHYRVLREVEGRSARVDDPDAIGYLPVLAPFSSSVGDHQFATIRLFADGALETVLGFHVDDPTVASTARPGHDRIAEAWAGRSNAGAQQPAIPGLVPTNSQACRGITEGDIDLLEWFLLNAPPPAVAAPPSLARRGPALMEKFGCTTCHVRNWVLEGRGGPHHLAGDRRFFDLAVHRHAADASLVGTMTDLTVSQRLADGTSAKLPRGDGFVVRDIYTDFRHHDLGDAFYEYTYDGKRLIVLRRFRTAALWGAGSTAPYGHDGGSPTLDAVIRRHGGEAEEAQRRYVWARATDRKQLIDYLSSLLLYQPDHVPTDLDGDGVIAADFVRDGRSLGPERLRPELLFTVPPRYAGWQETNGRHWFSYELLNTSDAYGAALVAATARDGTGCPGASR